MYHSKVVSSNQLGMHQRLDEVVLKHIHCAYKKPIQKHNWVAFKTLQEKIIKQKSRSLILDSCCGTGLSSKLLAEKNPNSLVIGIDQSYHRLSKNNKKLQLDNLLLLQANCEDIWRLCVEHNIYFKTHYILYPNPWPKSIHFKRRWHGHAVFPYLNKLAEQTELRSNWKNYLQEFSRAWYLMTEKNSTIKELFIDEPLTLFEKKYFESGHALYQLILQS